MHAFIMHAASNGQYLPLMTCSAGLSSQQMTDLVAMLEQANSIVQQQRSQVQDALTHWRRSSGDGSACSNGGASPAVLSPHVSDRRSAAGAAIAAAISTDSKQQLTQLQNDQQQLLKELQCLFPNSPGDAAGQKQSSMPMLTGVDSKVDGAGAGQQRAAQAASSVTEGAVVAAAGPTGAVVPVSPGESNPWIRNLEQRVLAMQAITNAICETVQAKHKEVTDLHEDFTKVRALQ